jgi:hypothetical protein
MKRAFPLLLLLAACGGSQKTGTASGTCTPRTARYELEEPNQLTRVTVSCAGLEVSRQAEEDKWNSRRKLALTPAQLDAMWSRLDAAGYDKLASCEGDGSGEPITQSLYFSAGGKEKEIECLGAELPATHQALVDAIESVYPEGYSPGYLVNALVIFSAEDLTGLMADPLTIQYTGEETQTVRVPRPVADEKFDEDLHVLFEELDNLECDEDKLVCTHETPAGPTVTYRFRAVGAKLELVEISLPASE